jgi:hypothetical protein
MTTRSFKENEFDARYLISAEYEPVGIVNDPGVSEIPASPDHTHQLFDNGIDLTPYLQGSWEMYDVNKPARMYKAGNHIVVDGQFKNAAYTSGGDVTLISVPVGDPIFQSYKAAFRVSSGSGITEDVLDTTFVDCRLVIAAGALAVQIFDASSQPPTIDRLTVNAFAWRTDSSTTMEFPPDSRNLFTWDGTSAQAWDTGVWR